MKSIKSAEKSVVKKLNALRVTLSDEEREVLDGIVLPAEESEEEVQGHAYTAVVTPRSSVNAPYPGADEVSAHSLNVSQPTPKASQGRSSMGASLPDADEVSAHSSSTLKPTPRNIAEMRSDPAKFPDADEVAAHAAHGAATPRADPAKISGRSDPGAFPDADEVAAHAAHGAPTPRASQGRSAQAPYPDVDEVSAHSSSTLRPTPRNIAEMRSKEASLPDADEVAAHSLNISAPTPRKKIPGKIAFDAEKGEYVLR